MKLMEKIKAKAKVVCGAIGVAGTTVLTSVCHASEGTTPTLQFNFDPSEMFTWTNLMLDAMMPVLYITLGISLCFIIVGALKSAFGR